MNLLDVIVAAFASLTEHKLRTALTMLGMMFGVAAVIAMLSIGAGAEQRALALIDRLGTRNVVVTGKVGKPEELALEREKSTGLSPRDLEAIESTLPGVAFASPRVEVEPYAIIAAGAKSHSRVFGVGPRHREATPLALAEGRFVDAGDDLHARQVCVLGASARTDLFGTRAALGRDVKIDDLWCKVIGVLAPDSSEREIYLPITTVHARIDRAPLKAPLTELVVHLEASASSEASGAQIGALLDRMHGGVRDYEIVVPEVLLQHDRETRRLFDLVMGLIAGISLVVGGVGIVNIMLASVLEQTREIGVRRALGARRFDVQVQFLVTAFVLALIGGALGLALGVGIAKGVAAYADWPTLVTMGSIALSLGVAVGVGVISGFYPAMRAARLDPIRALSGA